MSQGSDTLFEIGSAGELRSCYLVSGDRVLTEPAAIKFGEAMAARVGCDLEVHRRPTRFSDILVDLRTFSLFSPAKIVVATETGIFADQTAAADLLEDALGVLPVEALGDLSRGERRAASRLLQVLMLFQLDVTQGEAGILISRLPDTALQGGKEYRKAHRQRPRTKAQVKLLREQLGTLLERARLEAVQACGEGDLLQLSEILENGLPPGHSLVLAESSVAKQHPTVAILEGQKAHQRVGSIESERGGGWSGLHLLVSEVAAETGVEINSKALQELSRRTLREDGFGRSGKSGNLAASTARFASEYRKLATAAGDGEIGLELVESSVEDRGQEDVWKILDAIGAGKVESAISRLRRLLDASDDPIAARLSFFSLLAEFVRHLTAVSGIVRMLDVPRGVQNYGQFKAKIAPALQADLDGDLPNPLAGLHPFRLHKAYLIAGKMSAASLDTWPWRLLEAELQLKGESGQPEVVLFRLLTEVALAK